MKAWPLSLHKACCSSPTRKLNKELKQIDCDHQQQKKNFLESGNLGRAWFLQSHCESSQQSRTSIWKLLLDSCNTFQHSRATYKSKTKKKQGQSLEDEPNFHGSDWNKPVNTDFTTQLKYPHHDLEHATLGGGVTSKLQVSSYLKIRVNTVVRHQHGTIARIWVHRDERDIR